MNDWWYAEMERVYEEMEKVEEKREAQEYEYYLAYNDGYKKAIEDFVNQLSYRVGLWNCVTEDDIEEVAEQLKESMKNE